MVKNPKLEKDWYENISWWILFNNNYYYNKLEKLFLYSMCCHLSYNEAEIGLLLLKNGPHNSGVTYPPCLKPYTGLGLPSDTRQQQQHQMLFTERKPLICNRYLLLHSWISWAELKYIKLYQLVTAWEGLEEEVIFSFQM